MDCRDGCITWFPPLDYLLLGYMWGAIYVLPLYTTLPEFAVIIQAAVATVSSLIHTNVQAEAGCSYDMC